MSCFLSQIRKPHNSGVSNSMLFLYNTLSLSCVSFSPPRKCPNSNGISCCCCLFLLFVVGWLFFPFLPVPIQKFKHTLPQSLQLPHSTASLALWLRRPPQERKGPGSNPACVGIFSGSSHTSDLQTGTPVATLPGAWRYRVSTGTGQPGVSILWLDEVERLTCNVYLSVAARKLVWADPSLRYTSLLLGR